MAGATLGERCAYRRDDPVRKPAARCGPDEGRLEEVARAYLELQVEMQRKYLPLLLTVERLCVHLNILKKGQEELLRLREMHLKHIRPLIARLQSPKREVVRTELVWLVRMSRLLPPFLEEFMGCLRAMRQRSQTNMHRLLHERVAAAAA